MLTAKTDYESLPGEYKLSDAEKKAFVGAVGNLKILDPAVGSGAFLMGALAQLTMALDRLAYKNNYTNKMDIIRDCLFGVDISPAAVQICRLRFFISMIIEQEANSDKNSNYGIEPLPNLDARVIAVDTLIKVNRKRSLLENISEIEEIKDNLKKIKAGYFHASEYDEKQEFIDKDIAEREKLCTLLTDNGLYSEGDAQRIADWSWHDQTTAAKWFDAEWMFDTSTFDIIIGNPPYVRLGKGGGGKGKKYHPERYEVFDGQGDIYYLFFERGVNMLSEGGHLTYITSSKYTRTGAGQKLRRFLLTKTCPKVFVDFGELPVFEAATEPAIFLTQKKKVHPGACLRATVIEKVTDIANIGEVLKAQGFSSKLEDLSDTGWIFAQNDEVARLINRIKGVRLDAYLNGSGGKMFSGIKTGRDKVFVISEATRAQLIAADAKSREIIKPYLSGGEIKRWWIDLEDREYLIFTTKETKIAEYPAIEAYLMARRDKLDTRATPGAEHWYAVQAYGKHHGWYSQPKIVYGQTSLELYTYLDRDGFYVNAPAYAIFSKHAEYLLGIMNSELMDFYYRHTFPVRGDPWRGGRISFQGERLKALPIVDADTLTRDKIAQVVKRILADPKSAKVPEWEAEMSELVYELYGITAEEKALVQEWQERRRNSRRQR